MQRVCLCQPRYKTVCTPSLLHVFVYSAQINFDVTMQNTGTHVTVAFNLLISVQVIRNALVAHLHASLFTFLYYCLITSLCHL